MGQIAKIHDTGMSFLVPEINMLDFENCGRLEF